MIRDNIMIYNKNDDNSQKCFSCLNKDHSFTECPAVHYIPNKQFIISKHLYNIPTIERKNFERRSKKCMNSRLKIKSIQYAINKLNDETDENDQESFGDDYQSSDDFEKMNSLYEKDEVSTQKIQTLNSSIPLISPRENKAKTVNEIKDNDISCSLNEDKSFIPTESKKKKKIILKL